MVSLSLCVSGRDEAFFNNPETDQSDVHIGRRCAIFNVDQQLFAAKADAEPVYSGVAAMEKASATPCPS